MPPIRRVNPNAKPFLRLFLPFSFDLTSSLCPCACSFPFLAFFCLSFRMLALSSSYTLTLAPLHSNSYPFSLFFSFLLSCSLCSLPSGCHLLCPLFPLTLTLPHSHFLTFTAPLTPLLSSFLLACSCSLSLTCSHSHTFSHTLCSLFLTLSCP